MPRFIAHFAEDSSLAVEIEAPDAEDARNGAWDRLPGSLCHSCTGHDGWSRNTGDAELIAVTDGDGDTVWEPEPESGYAEAERTRDAIAAAVHRNFAGDYCGRVDFHAVLDFIRSYEPREATTDAE